MKNTFITGTMLLLCLLLSLGIYGQNIDQTQNDEIILFDEAVDSSTITLPAIEKMPEIIKFYEADYPVELTKQGIEGIVVIELLVNESGTVDSAKIATGVHPVLDKNAVTAAKKFIFTPAIIEGKPAPVLLQYEYAFSLRDILEKNGRYVNFSGKLLEKGTRKPISDAMVVLSFENISADTHLTVPSDIYLNWLGSIDGQVLEEDRLIITTDSTGEFRFYNIPSCSVVINSPIPGYEKFEENETLVHGESINATYYIQRVSYSEYEVVAYGKTEKKEVSRRQLSISEVKKVPGFSGDAIKVVQALPGVARVSFGSGEVIIRGSGLEDTRYFLDGVEIPILFHMGELKSTYNSDLLSSIDMYPGGFNTRYGGAIGGIVEIKGRQAKTDRWHGNIDINALDASLMAEGPVTNKLSLSISGRKSFIGKFLETAMKDKPTTIIPVYSDILARLDYKYDIKNRLFFTFLSSRDKLDMVVSEVTGGSKEIDENLDKAIMKYDFDMFLFGYDRTFSKKLKNELRFSLGNWRTNNSFFGFAKFDFSTNSIYLRDELNYNLNKEIKLNTGIDADFSKIKGDLNILSSTGNKGSVWESSFSFGGVYTNLELTPFKNLLLIPGIRYDYYKEIEEGAASLRLTGRYQYKKGHTIKGALGNYNQSPKPRGQAIDPSWGNPELPVSKSIHYVGGYEWNITDLIYLSTEVYYNKQKDIPRMADEINPKTGDPYNFLPDMKGRMYGLELMLRHELGDRFFGWISYSLSRSERKAPGRTSDEYDLESWDADKWVLYEKDQTHNLQVVGSWRLPANWECGFRFRYVTGNPITPIISFTEDKYEYNADEAQYVMLKGEPMSDRMEPFVQLDLRVDKRFVFKNWMLATYLDLQNANYFFYNSPEQYDYNYDYSERKVIGSIILPSIGIRTEF